ncbi:glycosyltransferase involved in cell wall biosynthesis [Trueperella bonasi]|uniref:Glycosyltransferase involved in cell wall biosynthesis n=1 Tax=Trueperella bonasi TaxID=312286 RepID=A0ABT9NF45_9ACTO|nr:glycosyltransferase involved in cell wall biosynthesis [Trueperella bonasi]
MESFVPTGNLTEFEIIIVNDGSSDETLAVANSLTKDPRVRVLSLSRNFGKEAAMLAGLDHAVGEAVVIMDSDLQHPPPHCCAI